MTKIAKSSESGSVANRNPVLSSPDPIAPKSLDDGQVSKARLKRLGGSDDDDFNRALAEATKATAWVANEADRAAAVKTIGCGLAAIAPRDALEGLIGAQMLAAHQASLECYRRAMIGGQTVEGRAMNLKHATKASTTFAVLLDTLNRHRGRAPQRVVVEHRHLHFHESGKAPDGQTEPGPAAGAKIENRGQPHEQRSIAHASEPALRSEKQERRPVRLPCDEGSEPLPAARGSEPRCAQG